MNQPKRLNGAEVLPPMNPRPTPAKGNTPKAKQAAAGRFRTLNAFVDATMAGLCRGDIAVWLVLYRATRDGTARTSQPTSPAAPD